jgi:translation initiation factor IF-3
VNERINAPVVRVVGENFEQKIVTIREAIEIANQMELDLVEISGTANPPVCKLVDYSKFLYEMKKKQKEMKAKSAKVVVKEIRLGPNTDDHDFEFKLKHATKFLQEGAKVKVEVFFRGRSIVYKDHGEIIMLKFAQELAEVGKVESLPKLEGKRMIMIIAPKK